MDCVLWFVSGHKKANTTYDTRQVLWKGLTLYSFSEFGRWAFYGSFERSASFAFAGSSSGAGDAHGVGRGPESLVRGPPVGDGRVADAAPGDQPARRRRLAGARPTKGRASPSGLNAIPADPATPVPRRVT